MSPQKLTLRERTHSRTTLEVDSTTVCVCAREGTSTACPHPSAACLHPSASVALGQSALTASRRTTRLVTPNFSGACFSSDSSQYRHQPGKPQNCVPLRDPNRTPGLSEHGRNKTTRWITASFLHHCLQRLAPIDRTIRPSFPPRRVQKGGRRRAWKPEPFSYLPVTGAHRALVPAASPPLPHQRA